MRTRNEKQAVRQSISMGRASLKTKLTSTELQVPPGDKSPGALPPYRTYVPLVHGVTLSTSIYLCAMYDWHGSDIRSTYITVLTCTVLQSHSLKQFTYAWLYWQYIHRFHNPVGK